MESKCDKSTVTLAYRFGYNRSENENAKFEVKGIEFEKKEEEQEEEEGKTNCLLTIRILFNQINNNIQSAQADNLK